MRGSDTNVCMKCGGDTWHLAKGITIYSILGQRERERERERERAVSSIIGFEGMKQSLLFVITEYSILFNNFLER